MNVFIKGPLPDHARNIMQRLGYGEQRSREGQVSFNRRFTSAPYPKYHAYVENKDGGLQVNLHLDQTAGGGDFGREHRGEYGGPLVEKEIARIQAGVESLRGQADAGKEDNGPSSRPAKSGGFWSSLFG